MRGRVDPEVGILFQRALEAAAQTLLEGTPRGGSDAAAGLEMPTAEQRRADALALLVELALSSQDAADTIATRIADSADALEGARPAQVSKSGRRAGRVQVVLHVDAEGLSEDADGGQAVLDDGGRVSAETSRRLACDASSVVMTHDPNGRVLDVGRRTRIVPAPIRRALEHRDRCCRFPGCSNRIADAHHIRHWADGGATRLDNLVLLCRRHHRAVHEDGYRIAEAGDGVVRFFRPDGRPLPEAPKMPAIESQMLGPHARRQRAPLVRPGAEVPWIGRDRLDLHWTLYMLHAPAATPASVAGPAAARRDRVE